MIFAALVGEATLEFLLVHWICFWARSVASGVLVLHAQGEPVQTSSGRQRRRRVIDVALLQASTTDHLAHDLQNADACNQMAASRMRELVIEVLLDALDFGLFDLAGALVLLDAVAGEDLHV
ncbi:hypothetical protein ACE0DR_25585 [Azotobacter sp. CWF10]